MKKLYTFLLMLIITSTAWSQSITNYTFSTTSGTYTPLTGGISAGINDDDQISAAIPIGFAFYFMGTQYTEVYASSNGFISFNSGASSSASNNLATGTARPLIAPLWDDLDGTVAGAATYLTTGVAPNRVFTFEWLNWEWNYASNNPGISFQVKLYESTGVIEFIYQQESGALNNASASIGIAALYTGGGFYLSLDGSGTNPNVSSVTETTTISTKPATGQVYTFTPPAAPAAPTNLSFSAIAGSTMTLTWTDNSSNETGFYVMQSTDGINYTLVAVLVANSSIYYATNLNFGTTYYWQIIAYNEGAGSIASGSATTLAGIICGNKTVGGPGTPDYASLTAAFNDINTLGLGCNVNLILQSGYDGTGETYPITSPKTSATGNYTLTIYPDVSGLSITSANATGTIDLSDCKNIIFDGRVDATGSTPDLIIENTNLGASFAIRLINDAISNTFKYCNIKSRNNSTSSGTILISTTTKTDGNDDNTITNCNIYDGSSLPYNAIYSAGTSGKLNDNIVITNNNIYNFWNPGGTNYGIYAGTACNSWTISNNNFYQTATRTSTSGATHYGIYITNTTNGTNFTISDNNIGGSDINCGGGSPWTVTGSYANRFVGIYLNGDDVLQNNINGNKITNFSWSSTSGPSSAPGVWCGIYTLSGNINIGTLSANIIGSSTGTGAITITISTTGGYSYGITNTSSDTVKISNNQIGSITTNGTTASISHGFYGIYASYGVLTIDNNLIGSTTTAKSIANGSSTGSSNQILYGIYSSSSSIKSITNNKIINLANHYAYATTGSVLSVAGIYSSGGTNTISNNQISQLSTTYGSTGTGSSSSVIGIYLSTSSSNSQNVSQNMIHSCSNLNSTAATAITGIYYSGGTSGTNIIDRNFIHSLSLLSTSPSSAITGIYINGGTSKYKNNMIRLGIDQAGASILPSYSITGIYDNSGTNDIIFNSVYIGGSGVESGAAATYAFKSIVTTNTRIFKNNIFINSRSNNTGTGKHYAVSAGGSTVNPTGLTIDYNIYFANGTGGVLGFYNATDVTTLADWQTAVGQDIGSFYVDPQFINATGDASSVNLHINTSVASIAEGNGSAISTVTNDFDGDSRSALTPTDIGADAFNGIAIPLIEISNVSMNPQGTQCVATNRTISATTIAGNTNITSVILHHSINGIDQAPISMTGGTSTGTSTWTATIPATTPANATVSWFVTATDTYTTDYKTGPSYFDEPFLNMSVTASTSLTTACKMSPVILSAIFTGTNSAPTYTPPTPVTNPVTDEDIGNVTIGSLNNTSIINTLDGTIGIATGTAGSYSDFTAFGPYEINIGSTYQLSVSTLQGTSAYANAIGVYIDYNRNGVFTDAGEAVYLSASTSSGAHTETASITIPMTAIPGLARMRVIVNESGLVTSPNMTVTFGEFEEYMMDIKNPNPAGMNYSWSDGTTVVGTTNPLTVYPPADITYTLTATDSNGCIITALPVSITTIPIPSTPTSNNSNQCGLAVPNCSVTSTSGATSPVFSWYTSSTGTTPISGITGNTYTGGPINITTTFYVAEFDGTCESIRAVVTANVLTPDTVNVLATPQPHACLGDGINLDATQIGSVQTYNYEWSASPVSGSGIATTLSGQNITVTPTIAGTYIYQVKAEDATMGCITISTDTILVRELPSGVTATASSTQICQGASVDLFSTPSSGNVNLIDENFNGATNNWITINNSTGGTPADAEWTLRPDGYVYSSTTFHSNDLTQFYLTNSDDQGSGGTTMTMLESPAFNLTGGETSCTLDFYQYFRYISGDTAIVEIYNGSSWITLAKYTATTGSASTFNNTIIDLSSYIGISGLKIRFNYYATYGWYWAIDNVKIIAGYPPISYTWTSTPAGYTSSVQNPISVYPSLTTIYNVIVEDNYGCADNADVTVDVFTPVNINFTDTIICANHTITLDAGGAPGAYLWSTGETTSSIVVDSTGYGIGTFDFWLEINNVCISKDTIEITFDPCTGINEASMADIRVYPNPADNIIYLLSDNFEENMTLTIMSAEGRLLMSEKISGLKGNHNNKEVDISSLADGVYYLRFISDVTTKVIPIVKK